MSSGHKASSTGEIYDRPLVGIFGNTDSSAGLHQEGYPVFSKNGHNCQGAGSFVLNETIVAIRPPVFRFGREGDERAKTDVSDIQETNLHLMDRGLHEVAEMWLERFADGYRPTTGSEAERVMMHKESSELAPICPEGVPQIEFSDELQTILDDNPDFFAPEFSTTMVETTDPWGSDLDAVARETNRQHAILLRDLNRAGVWVVPISVLPYGVDKKSLSRHVYVDGVINFIGWEKIQHFIGSSQQIHSEMLDPRAGNAALNWFEEVSATLMAGTMSAPFANGKISYEYKSTRDYSRIMGSPSGGPFVEPLPVDPGEILALSDQKMRNSEIPTPDRIAGHHTNRPRYTKGTIEICDFDNFGDRPERKKAYQELCRNLLTRLQLEYLQDEGATMLKEWGQYFSYNPTSPDPAIFAPGGRNHKNRELASKKATQATLQGADSRQYSAREIVHGLMQFADEMFTLSDETKEEFAKAYCSENELQEKFKESRAKNGGIVDPYDYYEYGYGTMADWLQELAKDLQIQTTDGELTQQVVLRAAEAHYKRWDQLRKEFDLAA